MTARDIIAMHDRLKTRMPLALSIPRLAPSVNTMLRMHWAKRSRLQQAWTWEVKAQARVKIDGKARVVVTRYYARNPLDPDSLTGSAKLPIDALIHAGVIRNDTAEDICLVCRQVKVDRVKDERTVIEVEEIGRRAA